VNTCDFSHEMKRLTNYKYNIIINLERQMYSKADTISNG